MNNHYPHTKESKLEVRKIIHLKILFKEVSYVFNNTKGELSHIYEL